MIKYLIVALCDTSVEFCHYSNTKTEPRLMDKKVLEEAVRFCFLENLSLQILYPDYTIPLEYEEVLSRIPHIKIKPLSAMHGADVCCLHSLEDILSVKGIETLIVRSTFQDVLCHKDILFEHVGSVRRLNIVFSDVNLDEKDFKRYSDFLSELSDTVFHCYELGLCPQINLITDRIFLNGMNNCNAGVESITLAPDGNFYICPGFYQEGEDSVGNIAKGINIPNQQLYKLSYAPICRGCDAFHCKRCVWLNKRMTLEVNTPSREQCVMSHIERNNSRILSTRLQHMGVITSENSIKEIDYLDPFEKIVNI